MFHSADKYYRRQLELLKEEHPKSYAVMEDFAEDMLVEGLSIYKLYSYLLWLRKLLKAVDKRIEELDKKDVRDQSTSKIKINIISLLKSHKVLILQDKRTVLSRKNISMKRCGVVMRKS